VHAIGLPDTRQMITLAAVHHESNQRQRYHFDRSIFPCHAPGIYEQPQAIAKTIDLHLKNDILFPGELHAIEARCSPSRS